MGPVSASISENVAFNVSMSRKSQSSGLFEIGIGQRQTTHPLAGGSENRIEHRRCRDRDGGLRLRVRNQLSGVAEALTEVRAYAEQQGISISRIRRLMAVIDELLNNTIAYGCKELGNRAEIGLELIQSGDRLVLTLHDNGEPFNPIALQSPDIASESQERRIGGLGIHLVRGLTSASRYKYENGRNRLTLEMR